MIARVFLHWVAYASLAGYCVGVLAAKPPFAIDAAAADGKEIVLAVPANGEVSFTLIRTGAVPAGAVDLHVSSFSNGQGHTAAVSVAAGSVKPNADLQGIKLAGPVLPVRLIARDLRPGSRYSGTLVLSAGGFDTPQVWPIALTAAASRDAILVADRNSLSLSVKSPAFFTFKAPESPDVSIHLFDKNRKAPIEAVSVRQESAGPGSTFDLERHLAFWFNGTRTGPLGDTTSATRTIPPGGQATVGIAVKDLSAGEHSAVLRFQAANSVDDDAQKVALTVKVQHSIWGAILTLVAAGILSFVTTKIVVMVRQHLALRQKVRDLRKPWLRDMEPAVPVAWVRAMLKQSEDLSKRFWLTGGGQIEARLSQISGMLPVLQRIAELRKQLARALADDVFVLRRALSALSRIVSRLDADALLEAAAAQRRAELDALSAWLDPSGLEKSYWDVVLPAAKHMIAAVKNGSLPSAPLPDLQRLIDELEKDIDDLNNNRVKTPGMEWKKAFEQKYARLKVLWEHVDRPEYDELIALRDKPLEKLFKVSDHAAWQRLGAATREIVRESAGDAAEAYTPLTFKLVTLQDPDLQRTYLVARGLIYEWEFVFEAAQRRSFRRRKKTETFPARSAEPTVVVFAPGAGTLNVKVEARYEGSEPISDKTTKPISIKPSDDFKIFASSERVDFTSFAIAGLIAVVSGLSLFYWRNAAFGTPQDYVNLFMWGIGVDQGKNLVQLLQSPAKTTPG